MLNKMLFDGTLVPAIWQGGSQAANILAEKQVSLWKDSIRWGSNAIDTAEVYGEGRSEEIVGMVLQQVPRASVFVATKIDTKHLRYDDVILACEQSLERMDTEYIDLYQIHWTNPVVRLEESIHAMMLLRQMGKIRYIGVCNCTLPQIKACNAVLGGELATVQLEYNLVNRGCERYILPYCLDMGIVVLAYSPLNDGKFDGTHPTLVALAKKYGRTPGQIALNWLTANNHVCALVRTSSEMHKAENAAATDFGLSRADYALIDEAFRRTIIMVRPSEISCERTLLGVEGGHPAYRTQEEALANRFNLSPSPLELSKEVAAAKYLLKPLVISRGVDKYDLVGGTVRYWAWVLAFGMDVKVECILT
jgi:diketogulonate reductase-like aldo/keto reductase